MRRATEIYTSHIATMPSLSWATMRVAEFPAGTEPERAAQLFVNEADGMAKLGGKSSYRTSVAALAEAKRTPVRADLYALWKTMLAKFVSAHSRRKQLVAALDAAFPGEI
jgi:hypothetical protein